MVYPSMVFDRSYAGRCKKDENQAKISTRVCNGLCAACASIFNIREEAEQSSVGLRY
jgi:hypothetical protein